MVLVVITGRRVIDGSSHTIDRREYALIVALGFAIAVAVE